MLKINYLRRVAINQFLAEKERLYTLVTAADREQTEKYKNQQLQMSHLLGVIMSRKMVAERAGEALNQLIFSRNEHEKPYCVSHPDIHFNVSHGGDFVVAALHHAPVGIDVETMQRRVPIAIARRFFSSEEHARLLAVSGVEQAELFFRLWTIRESYVKMTGEGIADTFSNFSVEIQSDGILLRDEQRRKLAVHAATFTLPDCHVMSVCCSEEPVGVQMEEITIDWLFK